MSEREALLERQISVIKTHMNRRTEHLGKRLREERPRPSELRAIEMSLDELEAYVSAVGDEDDAHQRHLWTIRKLREFLQRMASYQEQVLLGGGRTVNAEKPTPESHLLDDGDSGRAGPPASTQESDPASEPKEAMTGEAWEFVLVRSRDGYRTSVTVPKSECADRVAAKRRVWSEFDPGVWWIEEDGRLKTYVESSASSQERSRDGN